MPYIKQPSRAPLELRVNELEERIHSAGELNFVITLLCIRYLEPLRTASYSDYNEILGALEAAKLEFYRRAVAAYEEGKIAANGDVYPERQRRAGL
jgi:hypothetical protein